MLACLNTPDEQVTTFVRRCSDSRQPDHGMGGTQEIHFSDLPNALIATIEINELVLAKFRSRRQAESNESKETTNEEQANHA